MTRLNAILFLLVLLLAGCANPAVLTKLPTGEIVTASTSRFGSWERVAIKQASVQEKKYEARKAEAESVGNVTGTWDLSSPTSQALFVSHQALQSMKQTNLRLADILETITSGADAQNYTPMPKGAFAEFMDSAGSFARSVLDSSGAKLFAGLWGAGEFAEKVGKNSGPRLDTAGGDMTLTDTLKWREDHMTGNGAGAGMTVESPPTTTTNLPAGM